MMRSILLAFSVASTRAHVALLYPPGRTDNDYLYTFDGSCVGDSCDAFCGDPYPEGPVTTLPVDVPITLRWFSPVPHEPHQYRLSLNRQGSDGGFDLPQHILTTVDASEAAEEGNGGSVPTFSTQVTIPNDALADCSGGSDPCVLQLFDLYYFVSCANVVLSSSSSVNATLPESNATLPTTRPAVELDDVEEDSTIIKVEGASFIDYRVTTENNQTALDPALKLRRCESYTFLIDAPGHPFVIKTAPGAGHSNVLDTLEGNDGVEQGLLELSVAADAPFAELYYQCTLHPEMLGVIEIVDGDAGLCDENSAATKSPSGGPAIALGLVFLISTMVLF